MIETEQQYNEAIKRLKSLEKTGSSFELKRLLEQIVDYEEKNDPFIYKPTKKDIEIFNKEQLGK